MPVIGTVRDYRDRYECVVIDCPPSVQSEQTRQAADDINQLVEEVVNIYE